MKEGVKQKGSLQKGVAKKVDIKREAGVNVNGAQ